MKLIDQTSLASILDAETHKPTRDRKRLLYDHLAAATNRDQLFALLRVNLADAPEMLAFLDQITGQAPVKFEQNYPANTPNPFFEQASVPSVPSAPPEPDSTPVSRGRRRAKQARTQNQDPVTE